MRVTTNTVSEAIVSQIQKLGTQQARLQNQVSTGQRITQPEDDPAAVARVLDLLSEQRQISQYQNNAARALEISQASYAGLKSIKSVSDRASELATLGVGPLNQSQTQAYASEVNQLIEQTLELANSKFGNDYLYAGTAVSTPPFVATRDASGSITTVDYVGNVAQTAIPVSETATLSPTTDGATNGELREFLQHLVGLRDALNAGSSTAVLTAQPDLATSEDALVSALAKHGGIQTRIQANQDQQKDRLTELERLVSTEADADLPTTVVKLTQAQTAYQAALQSASNIMRLSLLDYIK